MHKKLITILIGFTMAALLGCNDNNPIAPSTGSSSSMADVLLSSSSSAEPVDLGAIPTAELLPWNGYQAAYSIIMDDFCMGTTSSLTQAEADAYARGLVISVALVTGSCSEEEWAVAKTMVEHGSEIVNHSDSHTNAEMLTATDIEIEAGHSTALIQEKTGVRPEFFGYPFDFATNEFQDALKSLGYLGSRSYNKRSHSNQGFNKTTLVDGFKVEYDARQNAANLQYQVYGMQEYVDLAIEKQMWAIRETHGVADNSYGYWENDEFISHLDYLASQQNAGKLWVTTPSKALRYVQLAKQLTWEFVATPTAYEVHWTTIADSLTKYATPIKLRFSGNWTVQQNDIDMGAMRADGFTSVSVNPALGILRLIPLP